jgi:hypothetical protein
VQRRRPLVFHLLQEAPPAAAPLASPPPSLPYNPPALCAGVWGGWWEPELRRSSGELCKGGWGDACARERASASCTLRRWQQQRWHARVRAGCARTVYMLASACRYEAALVRLVDRYSMADLPCCDSFAPVLITSLEPRITGRACALQIAQHGCALQVALYDNSMKQLQRYSALCNWTKSKGRKTNTARRRTTFLSTAHAARLAMRGP